MDESRGATGCAGKTKNRKEPISKGAGGSSKQGRKLVTE